uniref:Uncharacterized protein n=1 Tax=Cyprinus carpio TaxID=7962 RepID=A0A8C1KME9_CYPCA
MVPSHIWTTVCYKHHKDDKPNICLMSVSELNDELNFADDCFGDNNKLTKVMEAFQKLINLSVNQHCFISHVFLFFQEKEKRQVSAGPDAVECQLVPENQKIAADSSRCSSVTESDYKCQCNTGGETKPCCSSPCLYQNKLNGYRCYSDQKLIECSPPYSFITDKGERCLDNHPCGTYGEKYYWCKTAYSWDYCSPPLWNSKTKKGQYCCSNDTCAKYLLWI